MASRRPDRRAPSVWRHHVQSASATERIYRPHRCRHSATTERDNLQFRERRGIWSLDAKRCTAPQRFARAKRRSTAPVRDVGRSLINFTGIRLRCSRSWAFQSGITCPCRSPSIHLMWCSLKCVHPNVKVSMRCPRYSTSGCQRIQSIRNFISTNADSWSVTTTRETSLVRGRPRASYASLQKRWRVFASTQGAKCWHALGGALFCHIPSSNGFNLTTSTSGTRSSFP